MKSTGRALSVVILTAGVGLLTSPVAAQGQEAVDVIIQTDGPTNALVSHIRAHGGAVRFNYRNVDAVAAAVPPGQLAAITELSGVTAVEKDKMVFLPESDRSGRPLVVGALETGGVDVRPLDVGAIEPGALPVGYANFAFTGAVAVWEETGFGRGSIVAVVDSGTVPNPCLRHAVIGAPGFPDGYNATGDGVAPTDPSNYYHGTHVGGVIASACSLDFSADPSQPLYLAMSAHLPWEPDFVPIIGQAPEAQLYPVKVFPRDGGPTPTSVILDGLDHVLTLKREGLVDIDIVNMSLGGGTLFDGLDAFDRFVLELWKENILVVVAATNSGPTPNTIGSPATAYNAIAVGALDYAATSRVLYEYLGLAYLGTVGQGLVMRPGDETRVANFSSRGPISDGRAGPDISALGVWSFQMSPNGGFYWANGTSFSAPAVAGGAALLNAYLENTMGHETHPYVLRGALTRGANPHVVSPAWRGINDQGQGALDVPAALQKLKRGDWWFNPFPYSGPLAANVLPRPRKNRIDTYESDTVTLAPGEMVDFTLRVNRYTSEVAIEILEITTEDNWAYAFWSNALEVNIQSAKRTDLGRPVDFLWHPFAWGDHVTYTIGDGLWIEQSDAGTYVLADQPMEPGVLKVTLGGDYTNEVDIACRVRITRKGLRKPPTNRIAREMIRLNDSFSFPVEIPELTGRATFELTWFRDWRRFPTNDLDMGIYDPDGQLVSFDGMTWSSPERVVINSPRAGTWTVVVDGYEVYGADVFSLYLTTEE